MKKIKTAFRAELSGGIGTGHFVRMNALASAMREVCSECECVFFKSEDEPVNYSGFDIIILDAYTLSDTYIAGLNKPGRLLICYDDNALYRYSCDMLINGNAHAETLNFRFGEKKPKLLLGGKYALLRKEFRNIPPVSVRESAENIFVCFGGSDLRNFTAGTAEALAEIPRVKITAVLGGHTNCDNEVYGVAARYGNVTVLKTPPNMAEVMRKCDIAVTAGGSMMYELAASGLPALTITQADNQELIANYFTRQGLIKCIGNYADFDFEVLKRETRSLLADFRRRSDESAKLIRCVDKNGAVNAAKEIFDFFVTLSSN